MLLVLEPSFQKTMSASQSIAPLVPARAPRKPSSDLAWSLAQVSELFELPFNDLLFRAQEVHRRHFPEGDVELATLLSIKTGGCPEDCAYCPQAARYHTDVKATKLLDLDEVLEAARAAKAAGSNRFCMGAAWRESKDRDLDQVCGMVEGVKALGLETCATLGMLTQGQASDRKSTRLNSSHVKRSRMPSSA